MQIRLIIAVAAVVAAGCGGSGNDESMSDGAEGGAMAQVTGTLGYRERIALRPGAVAEVVLLDTSRADVVAEELARQVIDDPGSPPIPFALEYDPEDIRENMSYGVRAVIRHGDRLLFTTDRHYPVLTRGAGSSVDLMLVMVAGESAPASASLTGPEWRLVSIGDTPVSVEDDEGQRPGLQFSEEDGRVSGSTGCNSITGSFSVDGTTLELGELAATMRACIDGMDVERRFLDALDTVDGYEIDGGQLRLTSGGAAVLTFDATRP